MLQDDWKFSDNACIMVSKKNVTIQWPLSREVFWHEYAKIPRHTSQNAITEGDFLCILARNCEGTEQLQKNNNAKQRGE